MKYNSLLQQKVLEPLYVGLVAIKLVTKIFPWWLNHCSNYFIEVDAPVFSKENGDHLNDCPWNVSHYTTVFYHSHGEGVLGIGKSHG